MLNRRLQSSWVCVLPICLFLLLAVGCTQTSSVRGSGTASPIATPTPSPTAMPLPANASPQLKQFLEAAIAQSKVTTGYDPAWVKIDYPNGDVPLETGVCSDVVIRAFRKTGIDLQQHVHEDMQRAWSVYPKRWGARSTDANIDHRRVLNLMTYFGRQGKSLPVTNDRAAYLPGDVVAWELSDGIEHIGILTNLSAETNKNYLIVHNIGAGARVEDVLMSWKIIGHYRYY